MKLLITGGSLEAEIQGNPIEKIQAQLAMAIKKQSSDIDDVSSQIDTVSSVMDKQWNKFEAEIEKNKKLYDRSMQTIKDLQDELNTSVAELIKHDENNPTVIELKAKSRQLMASIKAEKLKTNDIQSKIEKLQNRKPVNRITKKITNVTNINKITKVIVKNEGIEKLKKTIQNMKRVPINKYPKRLSATEKILRADYPVHSSLSDMQDKLNAVPRMPI